MARVVSHANSTSGKSWHSDGGRKKIEVRTGGVVGGLVLADEKARDSRCRMSHLEPSAVYHMPHVGVGQGLLPRRKESDHPLALRLLVW